jgi:hypothetical protein
MRAACLPPSLADVVFQVTPFYALHNLYVLVHSAPTGMAHFFILTWLPAGCHAIPEAYKSAISCEQRGQRLHSMLAQRAFIGGTKLVQQPEQDEAPLVLMQVFGTAAAPTGCQKATTTCSRAAGELPPCMVSG